MAGAPFQLVLSVFVLVDVGNGCPHTVSSVVSTGTCSHDILVYDVDVRIIPWVVMEVVCTFPAGLVVLPGFVPHSLTLSS